MYVYVCVRVLIVWWRRLHRRCCLRAYSCVCARACVVSPGNELQDLSTWIALRVCLFLLYVCHNLQSAPNLHQHADFCAIITEEKEEITIYSRRVDSHLMILQNTGFCAISTEYRLSLCDDLASCWCLLVPHLATSAPYTVVYTPYIIV